MKKGKRPQSNPIAFRALETLLIGTDVSGRTASASFLIWFLQSIYRLDEVEAQDAVCDRKLDKGIDALVVNESRGEIALFQAKRAEKLPSTLGDKELKQFVGSMAQFGSASSVSELETKTGNDDLKRLLRVNRVAEKIQQGFIIRPIFVANLLANGDALEYLPHARRAGYDIDLWDLKRLTPVVEQLAKEWFVSEEVSLRVDPKRMFVDGTHERPELIIAGVSARELVTVPGIQDTRVFAQNVRLGLGGTRVNEEMERSIRDRSEHDRFLTFHNGLTIVAKDLKVDGGRIVMNNYSVSNGCQSLLAFYENRTSLTNRLAVLVRIVHVGEDRSLAASIAYRTNNQNPISLRDLSSNDPTQIQLQAEFNQLYGFDSTYMIKRGVRASNEELHNELAGQMLLALYVKQPWNAHQKYKVFGELKPEIFRYGIAAAHIRLAQLLLRISDSALEECKNKRVRTYGLTRFLILYLLGELLRQSQDGKRLLDDPQPYLHADRGPTQAVERRALSKLEELASHVVTELNFFVEEHGDEAYDYKSDFKSNKNVEAIRNEVLKSYEKDLRRDRIDEFRLERTAEKHSRKR